MQWILCSMIECSGFHAAWLNAMDFMQHGPKHPNWMQWIPCSVIECRRFNALWRNGSRLYAVESMQRGKMHLIECSGSHAPWKMQPYWMQWILWAWLNAVDSMQHVWMQWILCSMAQSIPIECSVFHAASFNEEYSMHCGATDPDCTAITSISCRIPRLFLALPW